MIRRIYEVEPLGAFTIVAHNRAEFADAILRKMIHEIAATPEARGLSSRDGGGLSGAGEGRGEIRFAVE